MIIKVKNADFSIKNVESIYVPTTLSAWTQRVIALYPSYNWSDANKTQLERFYLKLSNNGILDKIDYLAMPIFGNTIAEAVQNVVEGSTIKASVPSDVSSYYAQTMGYGLARIAPVSAVSNLIGVPQPTSRAFGHDCHFIAYPLDAVKTASEYQSTASVMSDMNGWTFASYCQMWGFGYGVCCLTYGHCNLSSASTSVKSGIFNLGTPSASISSDTNIKTSAVPILGSVYNSIGYISIDSQNYVSGAVGEAKYFNSSDSYTYDDTSNMLMGLMPIVADGEWSARRFGFLGFGSHLTDDESIKYQNALKTLVNGLS